MDRAFGEAKARGYTPELYWQHNGSTCGPASLVNAFRSQGRAVADEGEVLDRGGVCPMGMCMAGLTLDELAQLARDAGAMDVELHRDMNPQGFRELLRQANDPAKRVVVNFHRKPIFGTGGGHHSPIGGYLEAEDLVLVLDVNESYGPWLIERERLFAAVDTLDGEQKRGLLVIGAP